MLLSIEEHRRLTADRRSIVDQLSVDDDADLPTDRVDLSLRPPDL